MKKKILRIVIIAVVSVAVIAGALYGGYALWFDPYRGTSDLSEPTLPLDTELSAEQALADLDYAYERLVERHPAWLDGSDDLCAEVRERYEAERETLSDGATVLELWRAVGSMATVLGDGHTYSYTTGIQAKWAEDFTCFEGRTVTAIDGISTETLFERFCERYPSETRQYALETFSGAVVMRDNLLELCGVDTSDGAVYSFDDGTERTLSFVPLDEVSGWEPAADDGFVSWEIDSEHSLGIFDLDECVCDDTYLAALDEFFAAVEENECRAVAVDLRGNGGGNSWVGNEFLRYIDVDSYKTWESYVRFGSVLIHNEQFEMANDKHERVFSGDVYVLTDVNTYSAAMDFAMLVGDNGIGTLVGEASGNLPDSYGDCLFFQLPESKLLLSVSFKKWSRVDTSKSGQPLEPHIVCEPEAALEKVRELL